LFLPACPVAALRAASFSARPFSFSSATSFGHFRRKGRTAHLLLALVGFRADLVFAEAMVVFAKSPREVFVLFRNLLPRIARRPFRTQAPHFLVI
jgi:hypothetical protein